MKRVLRLLRVLRVRCAGARGGLARGRVRSDHSDHLARVVKCRALSGCCVATSLVACPGLSIARELTPLGWEQGCGQFFLGLDNWSIGQFS